MRVSVVIPAHNAKDFIVETVESALSQDLTPHEVIVVDDGSTDGTAEAVSGLPVVLIRRAQGGQASARNEGVAASVGDAVAFLDSDDIWAPGNLLRQAEVLDLRPEVGIVFGQAVQFRGALSSMEVFGEPRPAELPGTTMVRRRAWDTIPGMDPTLRVGEFIDWRLRAADAGIVAASVQGLSLYRRLHGNNLGVSASRQDYVRVVKAAMDRRRARA